MSEDKKPGRPAIELSEEQKELAIEMAEEGRTVKEIREAIMVDAGAFRRYLEKHPVFKANFAHARQEGLEELADSLQNITEEVGDVQKAKLKSENLRWILSKRKPLVYGDRIDVNVTQTIDITSAIEEAKKRSLKNSEDPGIIEAESRKISDS